MVARCRSRLPPPPLSRLLPRRLAAAQSGVASRLPPPPLSRLLPRRPDGGAEWRSPLGCRLRLSLGFSLAASPPRRRRGVAVASRLPPPPLSRLLSASPPRDGGAEWWPPLGCRLRLSLGFWRPSQPRFHSSVVYLPTAHRARGPTYCSPHFPPSREGAGLRSRQLCDLATTRCVRNASHRSQMNCDKGRHPRNDQRNMLTES